MNKTHIVVTYNGMREEGVCQVKMVKIKVGL